MKTGPRSTVARLTLLPSMLMSSTATQSFIRVLRKHGSSVRAVKVKYTEEEEMLQNMQQLLAFLAASCPSLVHISLPYARTYNFPPTNQLRLLVNSFPNLSSLIIKMYETSNWLNSAALNTFTWSSQMTESLKKSSLLSLHRSKDFVR